MTYDDEIEEKLKEIEDIVLAKHGLKEKPIIPRHRSKTRKVNINLNKFCKKCGKEIDHDLKRAICLSCINIQNRSIYNLKKEEYNARRRELRKKKSHREICVVCKKKFTTRHALKCTCCDECARIHRNKNALKSYYKKKEANAR